MEPSSFQQLKDRGLSPCAVPRRSPSGFSERSLLEPLRLPLVYGQERVGELLVAPRALGEGFAAADRLLLADFARQAGIAVHAVRLTADRQHSRERLVLAREEERRRLRRDLHDGLGPTRSPGARLPSPAFPELTEREREILSRIAAGRSNQEIAEELCLTVKTVRNYGSNIFSKLQVADRVQAALRAREAGLG